MKIPLLQRRTLVPVNVGFIVSNTGEKRSLIFGFEEFYKASTKLNWKSWCVCVKCLRIIPHPCGFHARHRYVKASIEYQCRRQEFKNRGPRKLRMWCKSLHHLHEWRQRGISVARGHDPTPSLATLSLTAYESYVSIHNTSGRGVPLIFVP